MENSTASVASDQAAVARDVVDQIDVEFEKYQAMRSAVRKQSGKWRRSFLTENAN